MTFLKCGHKTPNGWLKTTWQEQNEVINYNLTLPTGSSATFVVQKGWKFDSIEKLGASDVLEVPNKKTNGKYQLDIPSGEFKLKFSREK